MDHRSNQGRKHLHLYTIGDRIYQYDVGYTGVAPYVHVETSPVERLRLNAGLRFDWASYDYDNKLGELHTGKHRRPGQHHRGLQPLQPQARCDLPVHTRLQRLRRLSPRLPRAFRSQLFRQGQSINTVDLDAVKVDSFELGIRGKALTKVDYELSTYYMTKRDDILASNTPTVPTRP